MFQIQLIVALGLCLLSLRLLHHEGRKAQNAGFACAVLALALLGYAFVASDFLSGVAAERH